MTSADSQDTAKAAVLHELRKRIRRGELVPGAAIRQEAVARALGVSRSPVREALLMLQSEGMATYERNKGYVVAALDSGDIRDTYQLRGLLEAEAIRQGTGRIGDREEAAMKVLLDKMADRTPEHEDELIRLNTDFHFALFGAADNRRLTTLLRQIWDSCDRYRALYYSRQRVLDQVKIEHGQIYEACLARDAGALIQLHEEHRNGCLAVVEKVYDLGGQEP
jgi:DNA-binding GntR family transcriptional regulator